jgi:regulatory protein
MLSRREHSRFELQRTLLELGAEEHILQRVLDELCEQRLQSDERFAEVFIRSHAERGCGPVAITRELRERGLAAEFIGEALTKAGYDWGVQARAVRDRRFGGACPSDLKERARQYRFLQYRGFTGAQIAAALGRATFSED